MNEELNNTVADNNGEIPKNVLEEMPNYQEHIKEIEKQKKLDPFWEEHPILLEEAQELGAPLTAKEFKEQGFTFEKSNDGTYHVLAPTPAYTEWESSDDKENIAFRGYQRESIKDKEIRLQKEQQDSHLRAFIEDRKERLGLNDPEKMNNKPWDDLIRDREIVGLVYDVLYPNGTGHVDRYEVITRVINGLKRTFPNEEEMLLYINNGISKGYKRAFSEDQIPPDDIVETAARRSVAKETKRNFSSYYYGPKQGFKIMHKMTELQLEENLPRIIEKTDEALPDIIKQTSHLALANKSFFPKTIAEKPTELDEVFEKLGIDKNDDEITMGALLGYGCEHDATLKNKKQVEYFDLKNKMVGLLERDAGAKHYLRSPDNNYYSFEWFFEIDEEGNLVARFNSDNFDDDTLIIDHELSKDAIERVKATKDKLANRLKNNSDFEKTIETTREEILESEKQKVLKKIGSANVRYQRFDFGQYLDIKTLNINSNNTITDFISDTKNTEKLGYLISTGDIYDALDIPNVEVSDTYRNAIREGLLKRLTDGVSPYRNDHNSWQSPGYYLTKIFQTDDFIDNQERIGIDFNDPEIAKIAFNGFINTLNTTNGELSAQADWYYDNVFSNDPEEFLEKIKALREQSGRGIKAKITRFFKNNPRAFEDKVRIDVEKRFREEIINGKQKERVSVLREAKRGDIDNILNNYKKEVISQVRAKGAEEITTFTGQRTTLGDQKETGKKERKETPFDFGLEKGNALLKYGNFVESTFPDCNIHWFTDTFPKKGGDSEIFDNHDSYIGFSFEYNGKLCVIAESLNNEAAMYLWRGEIGEDLNDDFRQMFDMARFDAKRTNDPRIVSVGHLDKEHFDDSLDETYQKAFMFFNSGDKSEILYKTYHGREGWNEHRDEVLGAWPLSVEQDYKNYPEDLAEYHAWQQRQSEIKARLRTAVEHGGQDEVKRELEKIAEEDYLAIYNNER